MIWRGIPAYSEGRGVQVSKTTVSSMLKNTDRKSYGPHKTRYSKRVHVKARLIMDKETVDKPTSNWNSTSSLTKPKLCFWAKLHSTYFSAERNSERTRGYRPYTDKHGGESIMLLGYFSSSGVGSLDGIQGTLKNEDYVLIFSDCLHKDARYLVLGSCWTFQQDSKPRHNSKLAKDWSK